SQYLHHCRSSNLRLTTVAINRAVLRSTRLPLATTERAVLQPLTDELLIQLASPIVRLDCACRSTVVDQRHQMSAAAARAAAAPETLETPRPRGPAAAPQCLCEWSTWWWWWHPAWPVYG
uniref:Uncharacterized protein n=1 Tax=Triticum urartu TaxID=4572 RepID=A0A8R7K2B7_TRIUA